MADADRLNQLRRQRAKITEHLAWLDDEIARETSISAARPPALKLREQPAPPMPVQLESSNPSPALTANPDAVLEQWNETDGEASPPVSKTGCWIIFSALTLLAVGGAITLIYTIY